MITAMARYERRESRDHLRRAARGSYQSMVVTLLALGYAKLWRARITFDDQFDLFVCAGMKAGFGRAGTTIGGAYLTKQATQLRTIRHEAKHADQWAHYGIAFAGLYLFEELRHRGAANRFEIEAGLEDGGYARKV